jgi:hypothetical protein
MEGRAAEIQLWQSSVPQVQYLVPFAGPWLIWLDFRRRVVQGVVEVLSYPGLSSRGLSS